MISIKVIIRIIDVGIHIKIPNLETFLGWHNPFFSKFRKTSNPMTLKIHLLRLLPTKTHTLTVSAHTQRHVFLPPSKASDFTHQEGKSSDGRLPTPSAWRIALSYILLGRFLLTAPSAPASNDSRTANSCCQGHPRLHWHQRCLLPSYCGLPAQYFLA